MGKKKNLVQDGENCLFFNYQKSPGYRTIHVDGATLSTTPRGLFALTLYNERGVIPRVVRRKIISQGSGDILTLGEEETIDALDGVMRQIEVTLMLDQRTLTELFALFNEAQNDGLLSAADVEESNNE